jgi:phosphopantothenoylcysteine decarboxylase/phosphopantothenate--cysteine ligase
VEWLENPDILATVAGLSNPPYCVGFAAETGTANDLRERLPAKRVRKHVPLIVGNIGPDTFGADDNELLLCDEHGCESVARADKHTLAQGLIFSIAQRLGHEGIA